MKIRFSNLDVILGLGLVIGPVMGQTQVDLRTQGKNVDFSGSASTRPMKTGSMLPNSCQTGEMFFLTAAASGQNVYGCVSQDTWVQQNSVTATATIQAGSVGGVVVASSGGVTLLDADTSFLMTVGNHNAPVGNMTPAAGTWDLSAVDAFIMRKGALDPATCGVGELFVNTSASPVLKLCAHTNQWTTTGPPAGQVRTLTTGSSTPSCPATEAELSFYTIPAASLQSGDVVEIRVVWQKTGTASTAQMKIWFGSQQLGSTHVMGSAESFGYSEASVFAGSTSQRYLRRAVHADATWSAETGGATESLTGDIRVSFTGSGCSGGDAMGVDWFEIMVKKNAN